jgi:hypothetical protein
MANSYFDYLQELLMDLRSCIKHEKEYFNIQTPQNRLTKLGCASFFQPTSWCLDIG